MEDGMFVVCDEENQQSTEIFLKNFFHRGVIAYSAVALSFS